MTRLPALAATVYHVDCRDFAFRLYESSAQFFQFFCQVMRNLGLRRDRISEIMTASRAQRCFRDYFISFHQQLFTHMSVPPFFTL